MVVKAGACLGFSQCDYHYQPHKRDAASPAEGLLKVHAVFSQSPRLPIQEHFPVSVLWEVAMV